MRQGTIIRAFPTNPNVTYNTNFPPGFELAQLEAVKNKTEGDLKNSLGISKRDMNAWALVDFAQKSHSGRDFIGKNNEKDGKRSYLKSQFKKMKLKMNKKRTRTDSTEEGGGIFGNGKEEMGNVTGMGGEGGGIDFSPGYL